MISQSGKINERWMTSVKLIKDIAHRPYPLPSKKWIMKQVWNDVLFLHWRVPSEALHPYIPPPLQIDTFEGDAWIGIIAFKMEGIYFRGLSAISVVPTFFEINVRTYVRYNGKPGVYFLSLDVNDWASLNIAKRWYRLPYHRAKLSIENAQQTIHYKSSRLQGKAAFTGICKTTPDVYLPEEGTLDHWLTERYCLYAADQRRNIFCGDIHHRPWPLQKSEINIRNNTLFTPFRLDLPMSRPIVYFSKGLEALMWNCEKLQV